MAETLRQKLYGQNPKAETLWPKPFPESLKLALA